MPETTSKVDKARSGTRRLASVLRRRRILDAARDCFGEVGFASATVAAIAERAGVSNGLLYQFFRNKEHLFEVVLEEVIRDWVRAMLPREGITFVDNWADEGLEDIRYWSEDRLHLGPLGHARVASNVLTAFGIPVPEEWGVEEVAAAAAGDRRRRTADYYRRYVLPWIGRRLTGRSSGDGRAAKIAELTVVDPESAHPL